MLLDCTTRGCMKNNEALLNTQTGEVICAECGNIIDGITEFTKKALKSCGQVLRLSTKEPFQAHCKTCNGPRSLYVEGDRAFCKTCKTQVQVTSSFLRGLKQHLDAKAKEEREEKLTVPQTKKAKKG